MKDPRKIRQTIQAIVSVALIVIPWVLPVIEGYPKLKALSSVLGVLLALLTNPRLVAVLNAVMPDAGSSAVLPPVQDQAASEKETPIEGSPIVRKKDSGRFETLTWAIIVVALVGTLLCLWLIVRPGVARVEIQEFGGQTDQRPTCSFEGGPLECKLEACYGTVTRDRRTGKTMSRGWMFPTRGEARSTGAMCYMLQEGTIPRYRFPCANAEYRG